MTKRWIFVEGCDDTTSTPIDMTDDEFAFAQRVAEIVTKKAGDSSCKPRMKVCTEGDETYEQFSHWIEDDEDD